MRIQPKLVSKRVVSLVATVFLVVVGSTVATAQANTGHGAIRNGSLRPFTVADSIAMTHFEVPSELTSDEAPISPDGKKFFVITQKGVLQKNLREYSISVYDLRNVRSPLFTKTFATSSNRPGISQAEWVDDRSISLLAEVPDGLPQVYIVDINTQTERRLTSDKFGVRSYALSKNQKTLLYYGVTENDTLDGKYKEGHGFAVTEELLSELVTGGWRKPERVSSLYIQTLPSGRIRVLPAQPTIRITPPPPIWLSPNGRFAIIEQPSTSIPAEWGAYQDPFIKRYVQDWLDKNIKADAVFETALVDTETGNVKSLIAAPSSVGMITSAVWSTDSRSVVVAGTLLPLKNVDQAELASRKAHTYVASVDIASGSVDKLIEVQNNQWVTISPGVVPDTLRVLTLTKENSDLTSKDPARNFHYQSGKWIQDLSEDAAERFPRVTIRQSLDHWPILAEVDPRTKKETLILDPNPDFNTFCFGRREVIHWTDKLGQSLTGGLVYPTQYTAGTRYPLVIQTHGFNPQYFLLDGSFTTVMAAQELANKGILVLQLPQSPLEMADSCKRGEPTQSQIESAVDYLDSIGLIDRSRVGLVGFSTTGFNVRHALVNSKYHFAAAISAEGNDWGYWSYIAGGNWGGWMSQSECAYGGSPWDNHQEQWFKDSISFHYDKIHTPLRLESDSNGEYSAGVLNEWENFIALKRLQKPVELIYIPHGTHILVKPWDRLTSQQGNVDWMVFWLKGEEDPDPSKAEQYARWHELKKLQQSENNKLANDNSAN